VQVVVAEIADFPGPNCSVAFSPLEMNYSLYHL
jgi:hypothetical protein